MSKDGKAERKKGQPADGKTDYERLKKMSEEEMEKNAQDDPDAPLQPEEELKRFKRP